MNERKLLIYYLDKIESLIVLNDVLDNLTTDHDMLYTARFVITWTWFIAESGCKCFGRSPARVQKGFEACSEEFTLLLHFRGIWPRNWKNSVSLFILFSQIQKDFLGLWLFSLDTGVVAVYHIIER